MSPIPRRARPLARLESVHATSPMPVSALMRAQRTPRRTSPIPLERSIAPGSPTAAHLHVAHAGLEAQVASTATPRRATSPIPVDEVEAAAGRSCAVQRLASAHVAPFVALATAAGRRHVCVGLRRLALEHLGHDRRRTIAVLDASRRRGSPRSVRPSRASSSSVRTSSWSAGRRTPFTYVVAVRRQRQADEGQDAEQHEGTHGDLRRSARVRAPAARILARHARSLASDGCGQQASICGACPRPSCSSAASAPSRPSAEPQRRRWRRPCGAAAGGRARARGRAAGELRARAGRARRAPPRQPRRGAAASGWGWPRARGASASSASPGRAQAASRARTWTGARPREFESRRARGASRASICARLLAALRRRGVRRRASRGARRLRVRAPLPPPARARAGARRAGALRARAARR
jgi:hypothetical protein